MRKNDRFEQELNVTGAARRAKAFGIKTMTVVVTAAMLVSGVPTRVIAEGLQEAGVIATQDSTDQSASSSRQLTRRGGYRISRKRPISRIRRNSLRRRPSKRLSPARRTMLPLRRMTPRRPSTPRLLNPPSRRKRPISPSRSTTPPSRTRVRLLRSRPKR